MLLYVVPDRPAIEPTSLTVAGNLRRLRKDREWSLRAMAEKMPAAHPIGFATLGEIERGQRRVTVDDLMALALVLEVSPVALLMPWTKHANEPRLETSGSEELRAPVALLRWMLGFQAWSGFADPRRETLPPWAWAWSLDTSATL